ncbi:DUF4383 domain-containing protein [Nitriliruptor alkaliphilus]|uniref:DUF4383 domain-containing protein n=1 Tax=Nitriliruptor alkaliphilus TaxID=427918 RepID=UPI000698EEF3|nr:DUF4383 domain-containing protein [Nitriliruptor alkaliphilus]
MIISQLVGGTAPETGQSPAVRFARWGGVLYASAGIIGLALTGLVDLTSTSGAMLWVFEVNALQNLLHLLIGIALVSSSGSSPGAARVATMLTATALGVTGLLGMALVGTEANVLALNPPSNALHLATAALASICAAASPRQRAPS